MLVIDGNSFDVNIMSLKRKFSVTDTENSRRTIDAAMHRDVIGTFYNYDLSIERKNCDAESYDRLYDILSAPVNSHDLIFPYGQETLEFKAYITSGDDKLMVRNAINYWSGLTVSFVAMEPQRRR